DGAMAVIKGLALRRNAVVDEPGLPVLVEEERGIDPVHLRQPDRIAPGALRRGGGDDEIAAAVDQCADHIKAAVMMTNGRCEEPARDSVPFKVELLRTIQDMADLLPVDQVPAFEDRNAGKIGER